MRLVLHAGIHRTGTTSLQTFLAANRVPLALQGVAYPGDQVHHQYLAWGIKRGEVSGHDLCEIGLQCPGAYQFVLSAEDFAIQTDLHWLAPLQDKFDIDVVFYLRRQDHWIMSWYNQHIKWPFNRQKSRMSPERFLMSIGEFFWIDYAALLERWAHWLGWEHVHVAVVETGQVEDVRDDFVRRLGIESQGLNTSIERLNDGLPVHLLEFARHLGLFEMKSGERNRLLGALRHALGDRAPEAKTVLSPEQRRVILDRFAASNRAVAEHYFGRSELFLEPPPTPDEPYFEFPNLSRQELMREWVAPVIRALLKEPR